MDGRSFINLYVCNQMIPLFFEFFSLGLVIRFAKWVDDLEGLSLSAMIMVIVGFFVRVVLLAAFDIPFTTCVPKKIIHKFIAYGIIATLIVCESSLHFTAAIFMSFRASAQAKNGWRIFGWVTAGCIYATAASELVLFLLLFVYLVYYVRKHNLKKVTAAVREDIATSGEDKPSAVEIPLGEITISN